MLTSDLAGEIVNETMQRLNRNINMMNASGIIIASGNPSRIGQFHAGAAEAIRTNSIFIVTEGNRQDWSGAQNGINLPVRFHNQVVGAIGITGDPVEVVPFGNLVQMTTELMIRQSQLKLQAEWKQMTADLIVEELVQPTPDFALIEQRLAALPIRLQSPFQVAVITYQEKGHESGSLINRIQNLPDMNGVLVSKYRPQKLLLLFSLASEDKTNQKLHRLAELLEPHAVSLCIGISSPVRELTGIRLAYLEAKLALELREAGSGPVIFFPSVEGKALVHQIPLEHRDRLIGKLLPYWNARTHETLKALFACDLNMAEAIKTLSIHRNTLIYRLEQFKKRSGYDPFRFRDAMLLQFMIWFMESEFGG
ncbi:CdaR family transcriptional regulator [Paenibacillus pectinilyticus]|uniref:CdaR family transcriptional regulator n=1 Tax=Paenibacillus pectinilyticus TaxID=512399 RepID=UPI0009FF5626|nr:sugar diacid recognition domain-containing protein [Paenibacillus pectinilyticus]